MIVRLLLLVAAAVAAAFPAYAQDPTAVQQLQQLERALEEGRARQQELARQAQRLTNELGSVRAQLVAAATAVQQQEQRVTELRGHLEALRAEDAAKSQLLEREQEDLASVLASLARTHRLVVAHEAVAAFGAGARRGGGVCVCGLGERVRKPRQFTPATQLFWKIDQNLKPGFISYQEV